MRYIHSKQLRSCSDGQLSLSKPPRGCLPVLSVHSFVINRQLLVFNQRKRKNGRRNIFMAKSSRKNVSDTGIDLSTACIPSGIATDQATTPGVCVM